MTLEVSYQSHILYSYPSPPPRLFICWTKTERSFLPCIFLVVSLSNSQVVSFEIGFLSRWQRGEDIIDNDIIAMK